MKKRFFILFIFFLIISCSKNEKEKIILEDEEEVNLAPNDFDITIQNLSDQSATIRWNEAIDPENDSVTYTVYLDNKVVANNISELEYQFVNLSELTNYSGKIVAIDSKKNETSKS